MYWKCYSYWRGANVLIEKCDLNGSGIVGIAAYRTKNLTVSNNFIHQNSQYGIIYQGPQIEIKGNIFEKNTKGNIYFSDTDTSWPPNEKINTNQNKEGLKMSNNIFKWQFIAKPKLHSNAVYPERWQQLNS